MVVGHVCGRLLFDSKVLLAWVCWRCQCDAKQSFAVGAKLVSRKSGLRILIAMSGSLKSCFKELFDVLRMGKEVQAMKLYLTRMRLPKLQKTEREACYSKAKERNRATQRVTKEDK